jgi:heme/copper-type cytochrome/quinol oxidase subunit 2
MRFQFIHKSHLLLPIYHSICKAFLILSCNLNYSQKKKKKKKQQFGIFWIFASFLFFFIYLFLLLLIFFMQSIFVILGAEERHYKPNDKFVEYINQIERSWETLPIG